MIAYFALLSFVPLTFLALSLLGLTGRADESSFLVREIKHAFPGTEIGRIVTLGLEASFQVLPIYERYANVNPALRAFGGPAILLVWLYVMANLVVFGAEVNWWRARRRSGDLP